MTGMTLDDIRRVDPDGLHHAASALGNGARDLTVQHGHYVQTTEYPVSGGRAWSGEGQPYAQGVTNATAAAIDGVHLRLGPAGTVLAGFAGYLTAAKGKLADIDRSADNLDVEISDTGELTIHHVAGETPTHRSCRAASAGVLQQEARALLVVTSGMDAKAEGSLERLSTGDLTTPPSPDVIDRQFWTQSFDRPSLWDDLIGAVKGLVIPPRDKGLLAFGLWALSHDLTFGPTALDWSARLKYAHVVPRGENGAFLGTKDASWLKKVWWATHDKSWSAKSGNSALWWNWREQFGEWSRWGGRVGGGLTFAGSVFDQWSRDSYRDDLSTEGRVSRSVYRGVVVMSSAWAGSEAGALIGTAVEPGGGTVVGGILGLAGGVAGGAYGNWIVDQTIDHPHLPPSGATT
jgi:hypothetical protein